MIEEAIEFAKILKERNNKTFDPMAVGRIISLAPLKVNDGDDIILDEELIVTLRIQQLINSKELTVGSKVVMIANSNLDKYVVIDKVV